MKKITIEYDNVEDADLALNAWKYKEAVEEIWEKCFRKNNKHGYNDELLDSEQAYEVIEKIAEIYLDITRDLD